MVAVVEYLVVVPKAGTFCSSQESLRKLLDVDLDLEVSDEHVIYKKSLTCGFAASTAEVREREERYFHLHFTLDSNDPSELQQFCEMLRTVRTIVARLGCRTETLWDDVSLHYSKDAYVLIHRIENLMRRLILHFMVVRVGADWLRCFRLRGQSNPLFPDSHLSLELRW